MSGDSESSNEVNSVLNDRKFAYVFLKRDTIAPSNRRMLTILSPKTDPEIDASNRFYQWKISQMNESVT